MLAVILGVQLISFGLLAEMLAKAENRFTKPYVLDERQPRHTPKSIPESR